MPESGTKSGSSTPNRHERRRRRNRARLIAAAREVMARKGLEGATIHEITSQADLALGTFYNYFDSKEAVMEAVIDAQAADFGDALEEIIAPMEDRALAVAVCVRLVIRQAASDPVWGWFLLRNEEAMRALGRNLAYRAARDIRRGVEEGRFAVDNEEAALVSLCGIVVAGVRSQLGGGPARVSDAELATSLLQLLGVSRRDARDVAQGPLPTDLRTSLTGNEGVD